MEQHIDLQIVCDKLNEIMTQSPVAASSLLNINLVVARDELVESPLIAYPMGNALVVNILSLLSSLGDGKHLIAPASSSDGNIGVRLVPVNKEQEETL